MTTVTDICNLAMDILKEAPLTDVDSDDTPEANWFLRNYATARDAELKAHPWRFAIARRRLYPLDFPVDATMTGTLTGAWGLLRLTPGWSGDLATIRRSSDDTTDDFAAGGGSLEIDTDAVATFLGSGDGFISLLHDQSGNGRTLVQATAAKQPQFDPEIGPTSVPGLTFDGSNDLLASSVALSTLLTTTVGYMVVVGMVDAWSLDSSTGSANHVLAADSANEAGLYVRKGGTLYGVNDDGVEDKTTDAVPLGEPFVAEWRHTGGTVYSRVNRGTERSVSSGETTAGLAGDLNVGDDASGSQALDGTIFAVLTFSVIPTEAERNRLVERLMRWVGAGGAQRAPGDWLYRYPLPDDCLQMLPLRADGLFNGTPIPHEIEKRYILTDQASPIYGRYVQQFTDPNYFDPLFVEALSAKLAFKAAHWMTGKASMAQTAQSFYEDAIARARRSNCFEGTPEQVNDDEVIAARYRIGTAEADPYAIER